MRTELLGSAAILLCLGAQCGAWAQTAPPAVMARSSQLQEVVVTAQRRTQNIQKTAIPITAITGTVLKAEAKNGLDQILKDVPSLQIQASPQGADIVIRGVGGNDVGGIQQDPDVSVMEDNVYTGQAASVMGSVYDTQRIEVLRGPQGTLYGRDAAGGAVNILTNDPGKEYGAGLNLGYGNLDLRHVDGYANLPVNDELAIRIAGDRDLRHGYYTNGAGQIDNSGVRVKMKYTPDADFSLLGRFEYWNQSGLTETSVPTPIAGSPSCNDGYSAPCAFFEASNPKNPWNTGVTVPGFPGAPNFNVYPVQNNNTFYTYSAQADWNAGFGVITLIPSFTRSVALQTDASLFAPSTFPLTWGNVTEDQYTGEARINSPDSSPFKWVGGVYVLESNAVQTGAAPGGGPAPFVELSSNSRPATSVGGFAQGTYPVTDRFRATLGGRYNVDTKALNNFGICSSANGTSCDGVYYSPLSSTHTTYNSFTYKAGVEYDITPSAMGYAQISTGYKAGGISSNSVPPTTYQPESLTDYEIGLKSRFFDNRLQFNTDAYLYQYHNQQIELHVYEPDTNFLPGSLGAGQSVDQLLDVNAGNSRYEGIEEQAKYQVTPNDLINLDVAWEHSAYGNLVIPTPFSTPANPNATSQPPGGFYIVNGVPQSEFVQTGKTEAHAPTWNGDFGYQHDWTLFDGTLTFHSSTHFQTKSIDTIQEWFADGATVQKGYHQTDLYLNYASGDGHWTAGLWVKNLENNAIVTSLYPLFKETLGEPRTYGMTVGYTH